MTTLFPMEKVIQIQLGTGGQGKPFVVALTSLGRILASSGVWSSTSTSWTEVQLPDLKSSDLDIKWDLELDLDGRTQ